MEFFSVEFFSWLEIAQFFSQIFTTITEDMTAVDVAAQMLLEFFICIGAAAGMFILTLILGGIALNTMAKKQGRKGSALAYLPFTNTYIAGKIAGEATFFGQKMKRAGLYAMIVELLYAAVGICRIVANIMLTRPEYLTLQKDAATGYSYWEISSILVPAQDQWLCGVLNYGYIVTLVLDFFAFIFLFVLFLALFRKYYARGPVLMTILCTFFPARGFVLFAVRKNTPVDYNEYLRRRAEEYARRNNPYGYGGNQYPPYNPPQDPQNPNANGDPFGGEFGSGGNDPFGGEFDAPKDGNGGGQSGDPFDESH